MNQMTLLLRNLVKYRRYTIPNIVGMGVAIAALITIFQFVSFELSYDKFYERNLCRVIATKYQGVEVVQASTVTYSAVGPTLVSDFPEIVNQTRLFPFGNAIVNNGIESSNVSKCVAVEPSFFEMFEMNLVAGSLLGFDQPLQLILTASTAKKVFGPNVSFVDIINRTVKLDNDSDLYLISGIVEDMPSNSHLNYNLFMSYNTIISTWGIRQAQHDWNMIDFRHYVELQEDVDLNRLNDDLSDFGKDYLTYTAANYERFELEQIADIYLSDFELAYDVAKHGNRQTIVILVSLAAVLFVVSWINFLNLNSSLALEKSKYVGIRKVLGIQQGKLTTLLVMDVLLVYIFAIIAGVGLSIGFTYWLQSARFDVKHLSHLFEHNYIHFPLLMIILGLLLTGIVIGMIIYVRLATSVKPIQALKARSGEKVRGTSTVSQGLLVLQFLLSIMSFCLGVIIYDQQSHIQEQPIGFEMDNLWILQQPKLTSSDSVFKVKLRTFKSDLRSNHLVSAVASNQRTPGQQLQVDYRAKIGLEDKALSYLFVDQDYLDTYKIVLVAGRNIQDSDITTELSHVRAVLINKRTLLEMGLSNPEDAVGKRITIFGVERQIVGVVDDYRQESLLHDFQPTVLLPFISPHSQIVINAEGAPDQWLSFVEDSYHRAFPGNSFEYRNLSTEYQSQYASVYSASRSLGLFTFLTVLISLFGMIALASLNLNSRIKEIGIRKILGASESGLYKSIVKAYLARLVIASVIAIPLIFLIATEWLNQFVSKIDPGIYHMLYPIGSMTCVVVLVLLLTSRKIISKNPVEVLHAE